MFTRDPNPHTRDLYLHPHPPSLPARCDPLHLDILNRNGCFLLKVGSGVTLQLKCLRLLFCKFLT